MTAAKRSPDLLRSQKPSRGSDSEGSGASEPLGVYVHFPWCLSKCPYCDFLSVAADAPTLPHTAYADAVLAELDRRAQELGGRVLKSVFFGGGTPSLWDSRELGRVLGAIKARFGHEQGLEVTVECNPTSFDGRRARALLDVGVNRVSIGVQSLDSGRLAFLGRLHDGPDGLRAVRDAILAGVPRVSADLIFGVAQQSPEHAVHEAERLAELGVTHLSAYALTVEPGTQFGALAKKGRLPLLAEDLVADSFLAIDQALEKSGFEHYEISNYARYGDYAAHNLGYWYGDDYLGLGCGAWGTLRSDKRRVRYRNTPAPDRYLASRGAWKDADLERVAGGGLVSAVEILDSETALRERIMLGLRLAQGLDLEACATALDVEAWPADREKRARRLIERGRLVRNGSRLSIPKTQWLFADGTIAELM